MKRNIFFFSCDYEVHCKFFRYLLQEQLSGSGQKSLRSRPATLTEEGPTSGTFPGSFLKFFRTAECEHLFLFAQLVWIKRCYNIAI